VRLRATNIGLCAISVIAGFACALALATARPTAALAAASASPSAVITDCREHGKLTQTYTIAALRDALATMPADIAQYTDCQDVIQMALNAAVATPAGVGTVSGSSGGSLLPSWLIVVLGLLALAAAGFGALEVRRRRGT